MARHFELSAPPSGLATELGPGGDRVERLLRGVCDATRPSTAPGFTTPAPARPATRFTVVRDRATATAAMDLVDPGWLADLDRRRAAARSRLLDAGREEQLELAEHVAMLVATPRLDPADQTDPGARAVSGALLWLIGTVVAGALADGDGEEDEDGTLAELTDLLTDGWWPIGRVNGRFLITPYTADRGEPRD
ncbi:MULTISPECIES: hypothetical protein [Streptosporangium]|uniref:Uncharacterized protein n=1 Tax=Streptosporangium brasiliense TaxID=47480 RepID=A0ABT9RLM8_9ACTN|nr:hypothetical protein [Streptosporangium brasiliense]MDP9870194.1 hypothetical protein [Streptosporangium brasiliense]